MGLGGKMGGGWAVRGETQPRGGCWSTLTRPLCSRGCTPYPTARLIGGISTRNTSRSCLPSDASTQRLWSGCQARCCCDGSAASRSPLSARVRCDRSWLRESSAASTSTWRSRFAYALTSFTRTSSPPSACSSRRRTSSTALAALASSSCIWTYDASTLLCFRTSSST